MIIAFYPGGGGNRYLQRMLGNDWNLPRISYDKFNGDQIYENRYFLTPPPLCGTDYILTHCLNNNKIQKIYPNSCITTFIKSDLQKSLRREWMLHGHQIFIDKQKQTKHSISRLEHYEAIKSPEWPVICTIDQLDTLPDKICQEVLEDYNKVIGNHVTPESGISKQLIQDYIDKITSAYTLITWHLDYYKKYPIDFSQDNVEVIDIDNGTDDFSLLMRQELNLYSSEVFDTVWDKINE
jgi:hypothetical protein